MKQQNIITAEKEVKMGRELFLSRISRFEIYLEDYQTQDKILFFVLKKVKNARTNTNRRYN